MGRGIPSLPSRATRVRGAPWAPQGVPGQSPGRQRIFGIFEVQRTGRENSVTLLNDVQRNENDAYKSQNANRTALADYQHQTTEPISGSQNNPILRSQIDKMLCAGLWPDHNKGTYTTSLPRTIVVTNIASSDCQEDRS